MKINTGFSTTLIKSWQADDGVNFSIALAELTNWLLHVDWLTTSENAPLDQKKPLRVHVEDDINNVYDFESGKKSVLAFNKYYVSPLAQKRYPKLAQTWWVQSIFYSPEQVFDLPLKVRPTREKVEAAKSHILKNSVFLDKLPKRHSHIPAHIAAKYSFGKCILFAKALEKVTGINAVALVDIQNRNLYPRFHAVVRHNKEIVEDAWGIQPLEHILLRYGFEKFELSESFLDLLISKAIKEDPLEYEKQFQEAISVIRMYRNIKDSTEVNGN